MHDHTVCRNRLAASTSTALSRSTSALISDQRPQLNIKTLDRPATRSIHSIFSSNYWLRAGLAAISIGLLLLLMPLHALAAQVTLAWDANEPTPDGYCVYQREVGQTYDYNHPVWPADGGANHAETTCVIEGLKAGTTYYFVVRAHVGTDESGDSNEVTYQPEAPAPTIYTITASAGSHGTISPSGSISVSSGAGQSFSFAPNSGYKVAAVTVDGQSVGAVSSYTFSKVTQNHSISVSFSTMGDINQPPIAEAGNNQTVTQGDTVTLNGSGSSDPDGDTLSYQWVQKSGPTVALRGANTVRCTFSAPSPGAASATLALELTVTDSKGLQSADTCLIMVMPAVQSPDHDGDGIPDDQDLDDDNDGMPDAWEVQYNLDPFTNDANADADGDGLTNLEEYQAGSNPLQADGNQPPEQPLLTSPTDGALAVALTPWLKAGAFSDPDSADYHTSTQWRIVLASDLEQTVFERTSVGKHLTQIRVPRLVLDPSTAYTVQVRYFDNHGLPSAWSSPVIFTTATDPKDLNKNKIPDTQEVPADTDMNGDAVPDNDQEAVVKAVTTFDAQNAIAVSIADSETATTLETVESIDPATLDVTGYPAEQTPFGLIGYKIQLSQPGQGTQVTIYLSHAVNPQQTQWVHYSDDDLSKSADTAAAIDTNGLTVNRYLVDGGDEDADGTVNGVIVDLSGPRELSSGGGSSSTISTNDTSAGGGSGSGCFILSLF
jgi:hypothetical protein